LGEGSGYTPAEEKLEGVGEDIPSFRRTMDFSILVNFFNFMCKNVQAGLGFEPSEP